VVQAVRSKNVASHNANLVTGRIRIKSSFRIGAIRFADGPL